MTEYHSLSGAMPEIRDDLSIPQFFLENTHPIQPERPKGTPVFIIDGSGRKIFMAELRQRTQALATSLKSKHDFGENDVALIFSNNNVDYPVCIWAIHQLLGVVTPCNPTFTPAELENQLRQTHASMIIAYIDTLPVVHAAAAKVGISTDRIIVLEDQDKPPGSTKTTHVTVDELIQAGVKSKTPFVARKLQPGEGKTKTAFLSSSSGTTGKPKVVDISHYALIANTVQTVSHNKVHENYAPFERRRYRPGDVGIAVLPFYHIYGLSIIISCTMFSAMALVIIPKFSFEDMLNSIIRHRITHLNLVPPQVILMCKYTDIGRFDFSHVRMVLCAGAPLSPEINEQLKQLLPHADIGQAYGSTEATGVVSYLPVHQKHGSSGGSLVPGITGRVVKQDGTLAAYGEEGELHVKTPSAASGYYGNEEATRETFIDGWVRTGDLVVMNEEHEIFIVDRIKEIMKVRGFQVAPAELEGCLLDHPLVADVCVVGVPHDYSGEVPLAFVVPTSAVSESPLEEKVAAKASIAKHVADNKAPYKHLWRVEFIDAIPRNPSGKLLRRVLRDEGRKIATQPKAKL